MEVLVFEIGGQRYGVEAGLVREVLAAVCVTALPRAPDVVEGVIDVRGRLAAVFDLRKRFRHAARVLHPAERMVLAESGGRLVAFRCDQVDGLTKVDDATLEDPRGAVPGVGQLCGVARSVDGLLLIHDLTAFLSEAEAVELDSAMEGDGGRPAG